MMYHVVCHDCTTEKIHSSKATAEAHRNAHREVTGHDVEYAEVDDD